MTAKKINISYKYDKNYCITSPTDAYGVVNPKGQLVMSLFTDINKIPNLEVRNLDEKGKMKKGETPINFYEDEKEKAKPDVYYMDRIIHNTVILSPPSAIEIAFWMIDNVLKSPTIDIDKNQLKERFLNMLGLEEKINE